MQRLIAAAAAEIETCVGQYSGHSKIKRAKRKRGREREREKNNKESESGGTSSSYENSCLRAGVLDQPK